MDGWMDGRMGWMGWLSLLVVGSSRASSVPIRAIILSGGGRKMDIFLSWPLNHRKEADYCQP